MTHNLPPLRDGHGLPPEIVEAFFERIVDLGNNCLTVGSLTGKGYCQMQCHGQTHAGHRLAYRLFKGDIPAGLMVCHSCDTPWCCNPAHLSLGSATDNALDAQEHGLLRHGHLYRKTLTDANVSDAKRMLAAGQPFAVVARMLMISANMLRRINRGEIYGDVPGPLNIDGRKLPKRRRVLRGRGTKLNRAKVAEIKIARAAGESRANVAARYGVKPGTIEAIDQRKAWAHVDGPRPARYVQPVREPRPAIVYRRGPFTASDVWDFKRTLASGLSVLATSRTHRVAPSTVRDIAKGTSWADIDASAERPTSARLATPADPHVASLLSAGGLTHREIGERTGRSADAVWRVAKRLRVEGAEGGRA